MLHQYSCLESMYNQAETNINVKCFIKLNIWQNGNIASTVNNNDGCTSVGNACNVMKKLRK